MALLSISPVIAAEVFLRWTDARLADDPYLNFGQVDSFFVQKEINDRPYYQVSNRDAYRERQIIFPAKKESNTFRVFCLGGSASAGWPHPPEEIYSAYLQRALQRAYPHRIIEVINVSAHAYAAYRVRLIFQEIIRFDPDLVIIYSGNNEFLEKRVYTERPPWLRTLARAADQLYVVRRVRGSSVGRRLWPDNTLLPEERQHIAYEQWSKIEQLALALRKDPAQYEKVKEHYRFSIQSMVEAARDRDVPVILLTVPVNLRDWHPNVSHQPLRDEALVTWEQRIRSGRRLLLKGDAAGAAEAFSSATHLSPFHAESYFLLGKALETLGHYEEATQAYRSARDLDHNPFRAVSDFNRILKEIAEDGGPLALVDAEQAFFEASAPAAPGFDLFLDYVHPTKRGNLILARLVYENIVTRHLIGPPSSDTRAGALLLTQRDEDPYDEQRDYAMQGLLVRLFVMMHQDESALGKARDLKRARASLEQLRNQADVRLIDGVLDIFPEVVKNEHLTILTGSIETTRQEQTQRRLQRFYRDHFGGYEEFRTTARS